MKTTMTKEMADRKVNDAIAFFRQVEMEFKDVERAYQAAIARLGEAQEERDRLCEKEE